MKKLIVLLLAAAMLLSLAACASTAGTEDTNAADTAASAETPPEKPDGKAPAMADGETPPEKPDGEGGQPGTATACSATGPARLSIFPIPPSQRPPIIPAASRPPAAAR